MCSRPCERQGCAFQFCARPRCLRTWAASQDLVRAVGAMFCWRQTGGRLVAQGFGAMVRGVSSPSSKEVGGVCVDHHTSRTKMNARSQFHWYQSVHLPCPDCSATGSGAGAAIAVAVAEIVATPRGRRRCRKSQLPWTIGLQWSRAFTHIKGSLLSILSWNGI